MKFQNKTNDNWYPAVDLGSFYRLENGVLLSAPMLKDGSIDISNGFVNDGEVDFELLEGEILNTGENMLVTDRLKEIGNELINKP